LTRRNGASTLVDMTNTLNSHASMASCLGYVRDPANGYVTIAFPVEDGMEVSCWTGA